MCRGCGERGLAVNLPSSCIGHEAAITDLQAKGIIEHFIMDSFTEQKLTFLLVFAHVHSYTYSNVHIFTQRAKKMQHNVVILSETISLTLLVHVLKLLYSMLVLCIPPKYFKFAWSPHC